MEKPANKDFDFTLRLASLAEAVLSMFLQVSVRYCCVVSQSPIKKYNALPMPSAVKFMKSNKLAYKIYFFKIRKLLTEFLLLQRLCFLEEEKQKEVLEAKLTKFLNQI